jgi:hypothetical protein
MIAATIALLLLAVPAFAHELPQPPAPPASWAVTLQADNRPQPSCEPATKCWWTRPGDQDCSDGTAVQWPARHSMATGAAICWRTDKPRR